MNKRNKQLIVSAAASLIIAVGGIAVFIFFGRSTDVLDKPDLGSLGSLRFGDGETGNPSTLNAEPSSTYTHPTLGFSFQKPEELSATSNFFGEETEETEVITFETLDVKEEGFSAQGGPTFSWQIFIMPHDEPAITPERIQLDIPDIVMENIQRGTLDGVPILVFESKNPDVGETYEVWFVYSRPSRRVPGHLYQIMTYKNFQNELNTILGSWKFVSN